MRSATIALLFLLFCALPLQSQTPDDATYTVRIVFLGLMTFDVPEQDGVHNIRVLMPAVATEKKLAGGITEVPPHVAYVLATTTAMPADHPFNNDDAFLPAGNEGDTYHYLPLFGDQVTLDDDNDVALLNRRLTFKRGTCGECPTSNDDADALCWLPSMRKIMNAQQEKDERYFSRRPVRPLIGARAVLRYGALATRVMKPGYIWAFAEPHPSYVPIGPGHRQALTEEVHWTFTARGNPFVLNVLGGDGRPNRRIAFVPPAAGELTIVIGNTPHYDSGPLPVKDDEDAGDPPRDDHYSVYHLFRKIGGTPNHDGVGPVPHPVGKCSAESAAFLHEPTLRPSAKQVRRHGAHTKADRTHSGPEGHRAPGGLNCSGNQWP